MKKRLLFMIRSVTAGAVAMVVVSFGINAAPTISQGQGEVTFKGTATDAPYGIETQSVRQGIDSGRTSKSFLQEGGESQPKDLNIKLVGYDVTSFKKASVGGGATKAGMVALTFPGVSSGNDKDMLQTVGVTNTAIVAVDPHGKCVESDETTTTGLSNLADGDNTIHFTAAVRKDGSGNLIAESVFSVVMSFNLVYQ